jgi:hypothetical protein
VATDGASPNPYVGPRPFEPTESDRRRFYGRDREVDEIVSLVVSHPLLLVYAQSGAGKTSLFNAAVTPALERKRFTVLPLARVRSAIPEDVDVTGIRNLYTFCALLSLQPDADPEALAAASLSTALFGGSDAPERQTPRTIVFDQLEEVFTFEKVFELHPKDWQEQQEGFFREIAQMLADDPLLRVVFVIRKEFLAELNRLAHLLPESLQTQFRLDPLDAQAALLAVTCPLEGTDSAFGDGVAEELVEKLLTEPVEVAPGHTVEVVGRFAEPVQLQLVCSRLWRGLPQGTTKITKQQLQAFGDVNRVLGQFYDDAVRAAAAAARTSEGKLRRRIEDDFITSVGTRGTVYRTREWEALGGAITTLEDRRLIRGEFRAGTQWYELTHDRLIEPIQTSNKEYFAAQTARRLRRLKSAVPAVGLAAVVLALSLYFAFRSSPAPAGASASKAKAALSAARQQLTLSQRLEEIPAKPSTGFAGPGHQEIRGLAAVRSPSFAGLAVGLDRKNAAIWAERTGGWEREPGNFGRGWFTGAAQLGKTVVVVGREGPDNPLSPAQDATVWAFTNGRWSHVCAKSSGCGEGPGRASFGQTIWGVTTWHGRGAARAVAVGYDSSRDPPKPGKVTGEVHFDGAVWLSGNGTHWRRVAPGPRFIGPGNQEIRAVVPVGRTLVAAGRNRLDAAVWRSVDGGERWQPILSRAAFHAAHGTLEILGLAHKGSRVVAVGFQANEKGNRAEAAVWLSINSGQTWKRRTSRVFETRGDRKGAGFKQRGQQMTDVTAAPFGFVAVGLDHPSGPKVGSVAAMWTSLDGTQWTPVSNPSLTGVGSREMNSSALFDGLVFAAGDRPSPTALNNTHEQDAAIWGEVASAVPG